jgi:hypothetical protein
MMKLGKKDYMGCLTCVAFAVLLNLVVPQLLKLLPAPDRSNVFGRFVAHVADRAAYPVESSVTVAVFVFGACCVGKMFPLFK